MVAQSLRESSSNENNPVSISILQPSSSPRRWRQRSWPRTPRGVKRDLDIIGERCSPHPTPGDRVTRRPRIRPSSDYVRSRTEAILDAALPETALRKRTGRLQSAARGTLPIGQWAHGVACAWISGDAFAADPAQRKRVRAHHARSCTKYHRTPCRVVGSTPN